MRLNLSFVFVFLLCGILNGQVNPWSPIAEKEIIADRLARVIVPDKYSTQHLDLLQLKTGK